MGWTPCGCCGVSGCTGCVDGAAPQQYQVVLAGYVNGADCTTCDDFNGTFVLDNDASPGACNWSYSSAKTDCGGSANIWILNLNISGFGPNYVLRIHWQKSGSGSGRGVPSFREAVVDENLDCNNLTDYPVPYETTGSDCGDAAATCEITSL